MLTRASLICLVAVAAVIPGMRSRVSAQVAAKSPFMPAIGPGSAAAPTAGAPLEFRGYMDVGDGVQFRLFDPAKKAGVLVRLNEKSAEFDVVAKQHDALAKTLVIEHQGRTLTLAMRESKVVSSGSAGQMLPPPPVLAAPGGAANMSPAVSQSVVLNPSPADEQRRLEAVASEVARRRAMRDQATQQIGQGGMPPPNPPTNPGGNRPPGLPTNQAR